MNGYTNQYLENTVNTASPEQIMLMLYDGAIRFISLGIKAIENGDTPKRAYYINKTSAIISEFAATLDHNMDAQLAENLDALYHYMLGKLQDGNVQNNADCLLEVKKMLSELRETWAQAIQINKQEQAEATGTHNAQSPADYKPLTAAM